MEQFRTKTRETSVPKYTQSTQDVVVLRAFCVMLYDDGEGWGKLGVSLVVGQGDVIGLSFSLAKSDLPGLTCSLLSSSQYRSLSNSYFIFFIVSRHTAKEGLRSIFPASSMLDDVAQLPYRCLTVFSCFYLVCRSQTASDVKL